MTIPKICPLMTALRKNPNLISLGEKKAVEKVVTGGVKFEKIGEESAKRDAWWHDGYREAKKVEEAIKNGTYNVETPEIYKNDGGINLRYFLSKE